MPATTGVQLIADDAAWRGPGVEAQRGDVGFRTLVGQARRAEMSREAAGGAEVDRVAELEIRDGRVAAFEIRPARWSLGGRRSGRGLGRMSSADRTHW